MNALMLKKPSEIGPPRKFYTLNARGRDELKIQQKINQFAKDHAQHYLEEAEMTYLEKLRRKTGQTKHFHMNRTNRYMNATK